MNWKIKQSFKKTFYFILKVTLNIPYNFFLEGLNQPKQLNWK